MHPKMEKGFTLVEVLVALVLTAVLLGILVDGLAVARQRARHTAEQQAAAFLAQSMITQAATSPFSEEPAVAVEGMLKGTVTQKMLRLSPNKLLGLVAIEAKVVNRRGETIMALGTRRLKSITMPQ